LLKQQQQLSTFVFFNLRNGKKVIITKTTTRNPDGSSNTDVKEDVLPHNPK